MKLVNRFGLMTEVWPFMQEGQEPDQKVIDMLPSKLQLGIEFCHNIIQLLARNEQSIPRYTSWRRKKNSKKALTHTLCFGTGTCGRTAYLSQELSSASEKNLPDSEACDSASLCFHFTSKSENHINLSNSSTFWNTTLSMPFKAALCMSKFSVKIQLSFQFKFKLIWGESRNRKNH